MVNFGNKKYNFGNHVNLSCLHIISETMLSFHQGLNILQSTLGQPKPGFTGILFLLNNFHSHYYHRLLPYEAI